ncbi:CBS domain-containing protein [Oceanisphaera arctica]|uniref:Acetoin utilization protein AcuB n=1 Tax=Oceanisphaera arctica TaxID=641510 RepID=A0A2P5TQ88_9GAMM|nr:CBS domain-containing protein [Oceanisphaera arctica]PPL17846.1 acetoin utilization protein AcuB [Oceanisphaera arctica]GHA23475.1 acetoin utilization protein AcuB [Oceanisphaera arctica]
MPAIVSEIMSRNVIGLPPSATLAEARTLMQRHHIRHLTVQMEGRLVGLVSQRDILAAQESSLEQGTNGHFLQQHQIAEVMVHDVTTVSPRAGIREAALHLQKYKYGCLPVVDKGKLVGIVTDSDFVTVAIHLLEVLDAQLAEQSFDDFDKDDLDLSMSQEGADEQETR